MRHPFLSSAVVAILIALLALLADPFMLWMPMGAQMLALLCAAALAGLWAGAVAYERPSDEREAAHAMQAGRAAYLCGIGVLIAALLWQGFAHALDPWILASLGAMVLAKFAARLWAQWYR